MAWALPHVMKPLLNNPLSRGNLTLATFSTQRAQVIELLRARPMLPLKDFVADGVGRRCRRVWFGMGSSCVLPLMEEAGEYWH